MPSITAASIDKTLGLVVIREPGTHTLKEDLETSGTGIVIAAKDVVIDLNGREIWYSSAAPIEIPDDGWKGEFSRSQLDHMPGLSTFVLVPRSTEQRIESPVITLAALGRRNVATLTPRVAVPIKDQRWTVTLDVVDAITGKLLGVSTNGDADKAYSVVVPFVPASSQVRLVITATSTSKATPLHLGFIRVFPDADYGIVASPAGYYFPPNLATLASAVSRTSNARIVNGGIEQGQGRAFGGSAIYGAAVVGLRIDEVAARINGMDTHAVDLLYASDVTISDCLLESQSEWLSRRTAIWSAIRLERAKGTHTVSRVNIRDFGQCGIAIQDTTGSVLVEKCSIENRALVANAYAIYLSGVENFQIAGNAINTVNGRGISLDSTGKTETKQGEIFDNNVSVSQSPNLEYSAAGAAATALRIRNWGTPQRNLHISGNSFCATTAPGMSTEAIGARITQANDGGRANDSGNLIENNTFTATIVGNDPEQRAIAMSISGVDDGTGLRIEHNTLVSDDVCLRFGDSDSYGKANAGITFLANEFKRTKGTKKPHRSILAGASQSSVRNVQIAGSRFADGATDEIAFEGNGVKEITLGRIGFVAEKVVSQSGAAKAVTIAK